MRSRSIRSAPPTCATSSTFRGASTPPARVVTLEHNYRSTPPILAASNAVIALAARAPSPRSCGPSAPSAQRPPLVTVADEAAQARYVADAGAGASARPGCRCKHQAVLFRTAHHSAALELELVPPQHPVREVRRAQFLEAAHVKDVLAVLRWADNPRSRLAGFRVAAAGARHRPGQRAPAARRMAARRRPARGAARLRAAAAGATAGRACATARRPAQRRRRLARRARARPRVVRAASRAPPRRCARSRRPTCCSSSRSPPAMPRASAS